MTDEQLRKIEARAERATKGPWEAYGGDDMFSGVDIGGVAVEVGRFDRNIGECMYSRDEMEANADFIANARTDVPALVAEVRRLRAELELRDRREAEIAYP